MWKDYKTLRRISESISGWSIGDSYRHAPYYLDVMGKGNAYKRRGSCIQSCWINKLEELLKIPNCPFVLYVGKKKLIKRREFEKFLAQNIEI